MDLDIINLLSKCSIDISGTQLNGMLIERDIFLSETIYKSVSNDIDLLKKRYSSSSLTSLQKTAKDEQKWPLLNLIRQVLRVEQYNMKPIRKADGYTLDGKKKYKRYFLIQKNKNTILDSSSNY